MGITAMPSLPGEAGELQGASSSDRRGTMPAPVIGTLGAPPSSDERSWKQLRHGMHIASRSHRSEHDRPEQRRSGGRRIGLATLVFEDNVATSGLARSAFVEGQKGQGIAT